MASEEISASPVILRKRTASRRHRIHSQSIDNTTIDSLRANRALTARNRSLSRSSRRLPTSESVLFNRCQSQQKDIVLSSPSKLERQSTTINYQARLPNFHSSTNDEDQKRTADFRRRQIYALNHLMRNLEQEQFRQFCQLHSIGASHNQGTVSATEDTSKETSR